MLKSTLQAFLCALSLCVTHTWAAGSVFERIEFSGLVESELASGIVGGEAQKSEITVIPEVSFDISPSMHVTGIARLRSDFADELEPGQPPQPNRSSAARRGFIGDSIDVELREFYLDAEVGDAFLRLGKQQVVWGQADGLKVLDVLNPQSFREFILDDFEDSRIPLWSVNAEIPVGEAMLQLLWIPDRTYADIPELGAKYAFTSPLIVPELLVETEPNVPISISPVERPDGAFSDSDYGVKLSTFVGGWDLSLNFAYHYFDLPVVRRTITSNGVTIKQNYERTHLLGGTFSNVFGDFTLRGELGYSSDRYFLTNNPADIDGVVDGSEFSYVLGLDYQGWRDWFVSTQVFQSLITDSGPELVRDRIDTNVTVLVRRDFMNDTFQAEALLIQSVSEGDALLQASLNYEVATNIRVEFGIDLFYGHSDGLFGQFDANDRVSLGIEFGF